MEELTIQTATQSNRTAPVYSSTSTKLADERLERKTSEQDVQKADKKGKAEPTAKALETAVAQMNNYVEKFTTKIGFSFDSEREKFAIVVTDKETGEVIRQIPAKEVMELNKKMEEIAGIIFDEVG